MLYLFNSLSHYHCITLPYKSVLHYHFTLIKCIHFLALDVDGLSIALLTTITAPYRHEKRLHGSLYHNHIKPPRIAFKRVLSLCPFYRTCKISFIIYLACMLHLVLYALFTIVIALIQAFYIFIDTFIIYK